MLLIANLLTVALVTAAVQADHLLASSPLARLSSQVEIGHDPSFVPSVPWYMSYQGILKDSQSRPLTGKHDLEFTIYRWDQTSAQNVSVWNELHTDVEVSNGLFNVKLGTRGNPLWGGIFAGMGVTARGVPGGAT